MRPVAAEKTVASRPSASARVVRSQIVGVPGRNFYVRPPAPGRRGSHGAQAAPTEWASAPANAAPREENKQNSDALERQAEQSTPRGLNTGAIVSKHRIPKARYPEFSGEDESNGIPSIRAVLWLAYFWKLLGSGSDRRALPNDRAYLRSREKRKQRRCERKDRADLSSTQSQPERSRQCERSLKEALEHHRFLPDQIQHASPPWFLVCGRLFNSRATHRKMNVAGSSRQ